MTSITILGLGEAGRGFARGLAAAGADVRGYDPAQQSSDAAVRQMPTLAAALADADVTLSLVAGHTAAAVARDALPHLRAGSVFADLNSGSPDAKEQIAAAAAAHGVLMADVAVLAPVGRAGHRTPLLASGDGASTFATALGPFGVSVEVLDAPAGAAARRRLLRSVFMKGLGALTLEALTAADAAGAGAWLRDQIAAEFGGDGEALIDRMVSGTPRHAGRRVHEVRAAAAELATLGTPADITHATLSWLERLAAERGTEQGTEQGGEPGAEPAAGQSAEPAAEPSAEQGR